MHKRHLAFQQPPLKHFQQKREAALPRIMRKNNESDAVPTIQAQLEPLSNQIVAPIIDQRLSV